MISWEELLKNVRGDHKIPKRLLCLDPGETTGFAFFEEGKLTNWGQVRTIENENIVWNKLNHLFIEAMPDFVVCEDYKIYAHKLSRHTFSSVMTLRLIGGIDLLCNQGWFINLGPHYIDEYSNYKDYHESHNCTIEYQMATQAKGFVTDKKLEAWGFWKDSMRHARDAIRHGCYFLLFYKRGEDII
jgi:hypothetical protein